MPEEILYFMIRLVLLCAAGGAVLFVVTQIGIPLLCKMPLFPAFNKNKAIQSALIDIREYQKNQLQQELEDKKSEIELAALEVQIEEKRSEIDRIKNRKIGDKN